MMEKFFAKVKIDTPIKNIKAIVAPHA